MAQQPQQNFNAMRQDAIRRSQEMQRRAMPSRQASAPPPAEPEQQPFTVPGGFPVPQELKHLLTDWDGERLALLGLLYLLYKEGNDLRLLLAIAYILL